MKRRKVIEFAPHTPVAPSNDNTEMQAGCMWTGPFDQLEGHRKQCEYEVASCPHSCGVRLARKVLVQHQQGMSAHALAARGTPLTLTAQCARVRSSRARTAAAKSWCASLQNMQETCARCGSCNAPVEMHANVSIKTTRTSSWADSARLVRAWSPARVAGALGRLVCSHGGRLLCVWSASFAFAGVCNGRVAT